jgi:predicted DNA-binding protein
MARPKSDKTKEHRLGIRVSDEVYERLTKYTERHEQTITQAVIDGINLLLEKEDN